MQWLSRARRILKKPPRVVIRRASQLLGVQMARWTLPLNTRRFNLSQLLKVTDSISLAELWQFLSARPYPAFFPGITDKTVDIYCPYEREKIIQRAQQSLEHRVNLLGSGWIDLGRKIDWCRDYKTGFCWPNQYFRDIEYNNKDQPSDVKFPWELSRLQWLIPVGQAFLLTKDERYAEEVKQLLRDWIAENPVGMTVNWSCTMEVAMRIVTLTWLFHVFKTSVAWQEEAFEQLLLTSLYWHGHFTANHLEYSDVNGNHFTADATGLVFAGIFFGRGKQALSWQQQGWTLLNKELPLQVSADGVDYEASLPYHRLVLELFFLPALYRELVHLDVDKTYRDRVIAMATFAAAYSRPNGTIALLGDADDARVLPFGDQGINDHRYVIGWVGAHWQCSFLMAQSAGSMAEIYWSLGADAVDLLLKAQQKKSEQISQAFFEGGYGVIRQGDDHIFIDCAPVGLGGRGGHGHNDCLSFSAVLAGEELITDCGAYVYTASYHDRNLFRSTAYHNTPRINQEEINRFIGTDDLWNLHFDAKPRWVTWQSNDGVTTFCGSHTGYQRLEQPLSLMRFIGHEPHQLMIYDHFTGEGEYDFEIPLHLAPGVNVDALTDDSLILVSGNQQFSLTFDPASCWKLSIEPARISPSYGIIQASKKLVWRRQGKANCGLTVIILDSAVGFNCRI